MDLNELIMISASSILGGTIVCTDALRIASTDEEDIAAAVKIAKKVWAEVLRQERED